MKNNTYFSLKAVTAAAIFVALLLSGCYKKEIDQLKSRQDQQEQKSKELEERLAKLETWAEGINSQMVALQKVVEAIDANDFVKEVRPVSEGGKVVGYQLIMVKGEPITVLHGTDGDDGSTPQITIAKETDGSYYWKLNGEWIMDGDKKMPVTGPKGEQGAPGADAKAPEIRINPDSYEWEISTDGTNWTGTGIIAKGMDGAEGAQGPQGDKGEPGDSMFSAIDTSDDSVISLTLADKTTVIQIQRYFSFSIQPKVFVDRIGHRTIPFKISAEEYTITALNVPDWIKIFIQKKTKEVQILSNKEGSYATSFQILVSDGKTTSILKDIEINTLGSLYPDDENPIGVVGKERHTWSSSDKPALIVYKNRSPEALPWSIVDASTGTTDEYNGQGNMALIKKQPDWQTNYPAFAWADALEGDWIIPAKWQRLAYLQFDIINEGLAQIEGADLMARDSGYWTSNEASESEAYINTYQSYAHNFALKKTTAGDNPAYHVRPVLVVE